MTNKTETFSTVNPTVLEESHLTEEQDLAPQPLPTPGKKFPCRQCGAHLEFNPTAQALTCPYCHHQEKIPQSAEEIVERSYEDYLKASRAGLQVSNGAELEVKCHACGAVIMMPANVVTQDCPFCGVHLESQPHATEPFIEPSAVLPFKIDQAGAQAAFQNWIRGLWFAPNALKQIGELGKLVGMYTPFWTFDAMTLTFYQGERGTHYWETEDFIANVNGRNERRTRRVQRTRWQSASGSVRHWFDDVTVLASRGMPAEYAQDLDPWDLQALANFKAEYLSGFRTERYQVGLEEGFNRAKQFMQPTLHALICRDIGGDAQRVQSASTQYSGITFKHILLPIWISAYRYGGQLHRILINARTGEVQGSRPYSPWKIAGAVLLALAVAVLYFLFQSN